MELQQQSSRADAGVRRHFIGGERPAPRAGRRSRLSIPLPGRRSPRSPRAGARMPPGRSRPRPARSPNGHGRRRPCGRGSSSRPPTCSRSRHDEVVSLLARETGSTFGFGMFQMHFVPGLLRQAAALAYAPLGEIIPSDTGAISMGLRRPVGVVGAIAPWNAALILSARSIAAPLALGNTVVLKPSELVAGRRRAALGRDLRGGRAARGRAERVTHAPGEADPRRRARREPARRRLKFTGSTETGRGSPRPRAGTSSGSCSSSAATTR